VDISKSASETNSNVQSESRGHLITALTGPDQKRLVESRSGQIVTDTEDCVTRQNWVTGLT
jgi:hypothetical protein